LINFVDISGSNEPRDWSLAPLERRMFWMP